jgi:hypothetical protein
MMRRMSRPLYTGLLKFVADARRVRSDDPAGRDPTGASEFVLGFLAHLHLGYVQTAWAMCTPELQKAVPVGRLRDWYVGGIGEVFPDVRRTRGRVDDDTELIVLVDERRVRSPEGLPVHDPVGDGCLVGWSFECRRSPLGWSISAIQGAEPQAK